LFLDLGKTTLANKFLRAEELSGAEPKYPLRVGYCHECHHVQLLDLVPPQEMFANYLYVSSASDTLKQHLWDVADDLARRYNLGKDDIVLDVGCNDGTLLRGFQRCGVRAVGVDPASNLAAFTADDGIERYVELFTAESAARIAARSGQATLVTVTNTFPHLQNLTDFIAAVKTVLRPGGALVVEMHYLLDLIEQIAFDTVYHEHVSYWALGPMQTLFERHGMKVVDATRVPLHHGQLRVHVQRAGEGDEKPAVRETIEAERKAGLQRMDTYLRFAERVTRIKEDLHKALTGLAHHGQRVAGYGAPAKGNTLLSYLDVDTELLPYIADKSPLKQGLFTPGTHIPVVPPEHLLADQPDYLLLLAWNFADEIMAQQAEYRRRGGRFMVPVPEVRVLD
jgi:SAM-dependent methyltransferase